MLKKKQLTPHYNNILIPYNFTSFFKKKQGKSGAFLRKLCYNIKDLSLLYGRGVERP